MTESRTKTTLNVPCGSCHKCCTGNENVLLSPECGDDMNRYATKELNGIIVLQQKPNGDCVYLDDNGCGIHGKAPWVCRTFDCRMGYLRMMQVPREERRDTLKRTNGKDLHKVGRTMLERYPLDEHDLREWELKVRTEAEAGITEGATSDD